METEIRAVKDSTVDIQAMLFTMMEKFQEKFEDSMTKKFQESEDSMIRKFQEHSDRVENMVHETRREILATMGRAVINLEQRVNEEKIPEGDRRMDKNENEANHDVEI
jgi:urease accessory protein UreF